MGKAIFKFNNGRFAILCSNCSVIVKTGRDFTEEEWSAMEGKGEVNSIYCDTCKSKHKEEEIEEKEIPLDFVKNVLPFLENEDLKKNLLDHIIQDKFNLDVLNGKLKK